MKRSLLFAGHPDEKVARSLEQMCANMKTELAKEFAADVDVPKVVKLFADAILTRKRELERDAGQVDGPKLN